MIRQMIVALLCSVVGIVPLYAQSKNDNADSIVGKYLTDRGSSKSKVVCLRRRMALILRKCSG